MRYLIPLSIFCLALLIACTPAEEPPPPTEVAVQIEPTATATALATATNLPPTPTATALPPSATPTQTPTSSPTFTPGPTHTPTATPLPAIRQVVSGDCCTDIAWNSESTEIRFVDQPTASEPLGVWGVDVTVWGATPALITERLGTYNDDRTLVAYPDRDQGLVIIENLESGEHWAVDTQGGRVTFTPDNRLLWTIFDREVSFRAREVEVWLAETDGSQAERLITLQRSSLAAWYSDTELLVASRLENSQDSILSILSITDGSIREFAQVPALRDGLLSKDRRHLVYTIRFDEDPSQNGIWLLDFESSAQEPEPLPFFGAYRWRDNQHIVYVPFDPDASTHIFYEYNIVTKQSRPLTPENPLVEGLTIANNDWQVSPDGSKIGLVAMKEMQLDGIWVVEIGQVGE